MKRVVALPSFLSIALALVLCFFAIAMAKGSLWTAFDAYGAMFIGGLGDWPSFFADFNFAVVARPLGESTSKAAILTLTGLSVAVAFRVGLFNIGAQGQMLVGALTAAIAGAHLPLPSFFHPMACILLAGVTGAMWGLVPALLKIKRGIHEVISTIMLNWVAVSLIENWLVPGPFSAKAEGTHSVAGTPEILASAQLPRLLGDLSRLHAGFLLAFLVAVAVWFWLQRTTMGFETRAVGLGLEAAQSAGIDVDGRIYRAMGLAGALAGLAGAVWVLGTEYKFPATLGASYGFDGIAMALIGQNHPVGVFFTSVWFGMLRAGGTRMQLFGVHKSFPELIQGLTLLLMAGQYIWTSLLEKRLLRKGVSAP